MVISGLLGQSGHITVWLDGTQIVNADAPIGYYNDDGGARALAYPHWGLHQTNVDAPSVIYHANMEWGTADLSSRVDTPLPVMTPPADGCDSAATDVVMTTVAHDQRLNLVIWFAGFGCSAPTTQAS
jgi:hypothetical protein